MTTKAELAARVAWMQLVENRTNIEIAERLEMSRLRVPKLVRWAEEHRVVDIAIHAPDGLDWGLSDRLRAEYGPVDVLVSSGQGIPSAAGVAARYVCEVLNEGGLLGVAWGRGAQAMVSEMEHMSQVPQADVVQLIGGLPAGPATWHSSELLVRLSRLLRGSAAALLSPMVVPDAATARGMLDEPSIAHAFAQMERVDIAVVGIGAWLPGGSRVRDEFAPGELAGAADIGADVCGILLDGSGATVHQELSERVMSIREETLRSRPVRIAIALGNNKVPAIRAALRSGLLTVLCTDQETAESLLPNP